MNVVLLDSLDVALAKDAIYENIKADAVFVITSKDEIHEYINNLKMPNRVLTRLRICKELKINVQLNNSKFDLLSDLLKALDPSIECEVVVLGDNHAASEKVDEVREQLCDIIQQFVYLNIQLSRVHICTEKEAADNKRIREFEKNIDKHQKNISESISGIKKLTVECKNYRSEILTRLQKIESYIKETQNNELILAVAATKKAGKSVIVNSMIECEIAPTSLELATPNNCIYRKSKDSSYHLKCQNKSFSNRSSEVMHTYLKELFKKAEKDYKNGLGIPDVEIEYPTARNRFSSYVIYDTPGPDLAGATAHKAAAHKAVKIADIIIFTIDYSKYLTDDEFKYIVEVVKECQEKEKQYSLILNVNKLDMVYDSAESPSIPRIVDYIRCRLIALGKEENLNFKKCIVIGTSALTYFNAVTAPKLKTPTGDCSALNMDFSIETLKKYNEQIDQMPFDASNEQALDYINRATSTLSQLKVMIMRAEDSQKLVIDSLEKMKEFSGMPNLLSYIDYIGTQKARNEKVNRLLSLIDEEYCSIQNLFHFEELKKQLKENDDRLNNAIQILKEFRDDAETVIDKGYKDLHDNYQSIYSEFPDEMKSVILTELCQKYPIKLDDISRKFNDEIEKTLGYHTILDEVTKNVIPTAQERYLKELYGKKLQTELKIVKVSKEYFDILVKQCEVKMPAFIARRKEECGKYLLDEENGISSTMQYIWEERKKQLSQIIERCSKDLKKECSVTFDFEIPVFQKVFGKHASPGNISNSKIDMSKLQLEITELLKNLNVYNQKDTGKIGKLFMIIAQKKKRITLEDVLSIYEKGQLDVDIRAAYEKAGDLKKYLDEMQKAFSKDMEEFVEGIDVDSYRLTELIESILKRINDEIDETKLLEKNSQEIQNEAEALQAYKDQLVAFDTDWKEVTQP